MCDFITFLDEFYSMKSHEIYRKIKIEILLQKRVCPNVIMLAGESCLGINHVTHSLHREWVKVEFRMHYKAQ